VTESIVIRCSMKNFRVTYLVALLGAISVFLLIAGIVGQVAARGGGQVFPWLLVILLFGLMPVAFLYITRMVVDADSVTVHRFGQGSARIRRDEIKVIRRPHQHSGNLYLVGRSNQVLCVVRDVYSRSQLDELSSLLGVPLATD
jgi:hypothetical protein